MDLLISDIRIAKFCEAVRAKDKWVFKIGALGEKWAEESKLIRPGIDVDQRIVDTLWELKAEAERIREVDYRIRLHSDSLPERPIDYARISEDVKSSVKYARTSKYALKPHEHRDSVGIVVSDGLVPKSLHEELVKELDALASLEPKDFHPGTVGKVQDIIHPSMYPYIGNTSPVYPGVKLPRLRNGNFETSVSFFQDDSIDHSSQYAWVPSIFTVSNDRTAVSIDSYINGLGPRERYPNLYRLIEKVFLLVLPHFERTLETAFDLGTTASIKRWEERWERREGTTKADWEALLAKQAKEKEQQRSEEEEEAKLVAEQSKAEFESRQTSVDPGDPTLRTSFGSQALKVIVKAANYILKPGQHYQGTWHLEGMPHERIVASAIYYYDTNEYVRDDGLGFRRARMEEDDFPGLMDYNHESFSIRFLREGGPPGEEAEIDWDLEEPDYPSDWDDTHQYVPLGTVPTTFNDGAAPFSGHETGRIISFPNWVQHKVQGLRHAFPSVGVDSPPAVRKILCFFLVNDSELPNGEYTPFAGMTYQGLEDMHVLTTADIPPQNCATNVRTLRILLPLACEASTGKTLPPELVDIIVNNDFGLTREMAEKHRRGFMEDRKAKVLKETQVFEDSYSLCEH